MELEGLEAIAGEGEADADDTERENCRSLVVRGLLGLQSENVSPPSPSPSSSRLSLTRVDRALLLEHFARNHTSSFDSTNQQLFKRTRQRTS